MQQPETIESLRPLLVSIAYRMLGTVSDPEDVVQEAYLRWERADREHIDSPRAYLGTVVTRLSIDALREAKRRREVYVGEWLPEPLMTSRDPREAAELADSLSTAFLVLLESLSPPERAAFLLREVFGYEYATLRGHVEQGRMDYEVYKWRDDGAVEFRLHAHSRASNEGLPWVRLGFRLFGRREQVRFYFRCCELMARLTARELGLADEPPPPAVRLGTADASDTAELGERLVPRRTA